MCAEMKKTLIYGKERQKRDTLSITLTELFPQLRSYNGDVSCLPINPYIKFKKVCDNHIDAKSSEYTVIFSVIACP